MSTSYPNDLVIRAERRRATWALGRYENFIIFGLGLIANIVGAWWCAFVWQIGNRDALARTANAFYVLYSRDPHLASIGFVWPPLPSLLQLPLLPITKWLGHTTFAGPIVSAMFGALALVLLNQVLIQLNTPRAWRWLLVALTQLHPAFWYLAASGLAEVPVLVFLLATVLGYLMLPTKVRAAALAGIALAGGFFVRYEALAMIPGLVVALLIQRWWSPRTWRNALTGHIFAVVLPPLYAVGLWMFWNWQIMGDALFFQRSEYSLAAAQDVARNVGPLHSLWAAYHGIGPTLSYALTRLTQQNVAFLAAVLLVTIIALVKRDGRLAGLVVLLLCVPAFSALQVFLGTLAPWMRYWFYATPFAAILIGVVAGMRRSVWRFVALVPLVGLFALAIPVCLAAMGDPYASPDERRLHARLLDPAQEAAIRATDDYWGDVSDAPVVAPVLDQQAQHGMVLVDSVLAYAIIMDTKHPERLVITNDNDFKTALGNPSAHVGSILVLKPHAGGTPNAIEQQYPDLFYHGAPWATLAHDFTNTYRKWRVYDVAPTAGQ